MTDRELLELAAKAAGLRASEHDGVVYAGFGSREWNPLTDDGDALRLSFNLSMKIDFARCEIFYRVDGKRWISLVWAGYKDHQEMRRAIVRAAAEIGAAK